MPEWRSELTFYALGCHIYVPLCDPGMRGIVTLRNTTRVASATEVKKYY